MYTVSTTKEITTEDTLLHVPFKLRRRALAGKTNGLLVP